MSKRKGLHKYKRSIRVLPQTSYNLDRLADLSGLKTPGRVVDKLVREKMLSLRTFEASREPEEVPELRREDS